MEVDLLQKWERNGGEVAVVKKQEMVAEVEKECFVATEKLASVGEVDWVCSLKR